MSELIRQSINFSVLTGIEGYTNILLYVCSTTPRSLPQTSCLLFLALARRSLGVQFPWFKKKDCYAVLITVLTGIEGYAIMLLHNHSTTPRSLPQTSCLLFLAPARRSLGVQFPWFKKKAVFDSLITVLTGIEGYTNILPVCLLHHAAVTAADLLSAFPRTCSAFPWGSIPVTNF